MTAQEIAAHIGLDGVKVEPLRAGNGHVAIYVRQHLDGKEYAHAVALRLDPTPQDLEKLKHQFERWWTNEILAQ